MSIFILDSWAFFAPFNAQHLRSFSAGEPSSLQVTPQAVEGADEYVADNPTHRQSVPPVDPLTSTNDERQARIGQAELSRPFRMREVFRNMVSILAEPGTQSCNARSA
jgi:hypothetical protein